MDKSEKQNIFHSYYVVMYSKIKNYLLIMLYRAAERGGAGGGGNCPGPPGSGGPQNFFVGPQSFFGVKYFRAKGKIFVFFGQSTEIWYEKLR